jgi:hypothetical protein
MEQRSPTFCRSRDTLFFDAQHHALLESSSGPVRRPRVSKENSMPNPVISLIPGPANVPGAAY